MIPEGTTFIAGSIRGNITTSIENSNAVIKSMEYKEILENGVLKPGIEWVVSGMADSEVIELTFRVNAPNETDNATTTDYESSKIFTNTAYVTDKDKEVVFEKDTETHQQGENVYTPEEIKKESDTTYHVIKVPVLEVLKSSSITQSTKVKTGDTITYTISIKNIGDGAANNVIIRDNIPEYTNYIVDTADSTAIDFRVTKTNINGRETLIWIIDEIASGESITVSFSVKVQDMQAAGEREIKNTAQVKIPNKDENPEEAARKDDGFTDTNEVKNSQEKQLGTPNPTSPNPATPNPATPTSPPKTGDDTVNVEILIALLGLSAIITLYVTKRKKTNKQ